MDSSELSGYRVFAEMLADEAGAIARQYFQRGLEIENKEDNTPVTQADKQIELQIRKFIELTYPDHGIFGEEGGKVRAEATLQWIIDPIDGTRAFIAGLPTFCTLIALAENGVPLLGIIDQPIKEERWIGIKGQATQCNHMAMFDSPTPKPERLEDCTIATTSGNYFDTAQKQKFAILSRHCKQLVENQDAYAYAMLASGDYDVVIDVSLKPYDFMALVPVVEGAGGVISDLSGASVTLGNSSGSVVAARSPALLQMMLAEMSG